MLYEIRERRQRKEKNETKEFDSYPVAVSKSSVDTVSLRKGVHEPNLRTPSD